MSGCIVLLPRLLPAVQGGGLHTRRYVLGSLAGVCREKVQLGKGRSGASEQWGRQCGPGPGMDLLHQQVWGRGELFPSQHSVIWALQREPRLRVRLGRCLLGPPTLGSYCRRQGVELMGALGRAEEG